MSNKNIVAIGGGGFGRSLGELKIEKYITSLVKKERPKICFIPTASGDNDSYKLNFYRAFSKLNCITSHLDFFSRISKGSTDLCKQNNNALERIFSELAFKGSKIANTNNRRGSLILILFYLAKNDINNNNYILNVYARIIINICCSYLRICWIKIT